MADSVRPHRRQPTRVPCPWDSPGKNTGVGCHFLLQCMKVKSESEVAQSCPTLSDPMGCGLPGSSVHGISRHEYWSGLPLPSLNLVHSVWINYFQVSPFFITGLGCVKKKIPNSRGSCWLLRHWPRVHQRADFPERAHPGQEGVAGRWRGLTWGWNIQSESEKTSPGQFLLSNSFCYSLNDLRAPRGLSKQRWPLSPSCHLNKNVL